MSRPHIPIDWDLVDELLEAGCLGTEIAANFDMHPSTFYDRVFDKYGMGFTHYSKEKRAKGDSILRAVQFNAAVKDKDRSLLIWLGKQRLGQTDRKELTELESALIVKTINYAKQVDEKTKVVKDQKTNEAID